LELYFYRYLFLLVFISTSSHSISNHPTLHSSLLSDSPGEVPREHHHLYSQMKTRNSLDNKPIRNQLGLHSSIIVGIEALKLEEIFAPKHINLFTLWSIHVFNLQIKHKHLGWFQGLALRQFTMNQSRMLV